MMRRMVTSFHTSCSVHVRISVLATAVPPVAFELYHTRISTDHSFVTKRVRRCFHQRSIHDRVSRCRVPATKCARYVAIGPPLPAATDSAALLTIRQKIAYVPATCSFLLRTASRY